MNNKIVMFTKRAAVLVCCVAASSVAWGASLKSLTVCADPGNMPLSNQKGEGFENKIAQVIGAAWAPACSTTGALRSSAV